MAERPLRILFSMRNFWFIKLYQSAVLELAARGHHVHILADKEDWNHAASALAGEHPNITFSWAPRDLEDDWVDMRLQVRYGVDYLRFLSRGYADAPILEARAVGRAPQGMVRWVHSPLGRTALGRRATGAVLRFVERVLPIDRELFECVRDQRADIVLITPLLTLGSEQQDVLRAARRLGIPTVLCVGSWDHLSSKSLIRTRPDRVFVWNNIQRREATDLHGIPPDHVVVTGAQCFDQWFDRRPARTREAFCRRVGLDPARPFLTYACSALFENSPNEAEFARSWIAGLRSSAHASLREVGVLVRPHPKRAFEWDQVDLSAFDNVTRWPPDAAAPFDADTKDDYFESLVYSAAVVGLNTSAMIEAGIAGRPVHTVLLPELRDNQEGTLHFHYLLGGGLLRAARDLPAHFDQLAETLAQGPPASNPNRAFLENFVRPHGLDVPATPMFADAVEQMAQIATSPDPDPAAGPLLRVVLAPVARRIEGPFSARAERRRRMEERVRARQERDELARRRKAEYAQQRTAERIARREADKRRLEAERAAARAAAVDEKQRRRAAKEHEKAARSARRRRQQRWELARERVGRWYRQMLGTR